MTAPDATRTRRHPALRGLAGFASGLGLYLLLAGSVSRHELLAGVPAAAGLAALLIVLRLRQDGMVMVLPMPPRRVVLRTAVSLVTESWRVGAVLAASLVRPRVAAVGRISAVRLETGREERPRDRGRVGLVMLAVSLAPNGFVVDRDAESLAVHHLAPMSRQPDDALWPV